MMTPSNGNIFRVTGPSCGEFTGPGEFPTQRPVTRSFDVFFDLRPNKWLSKQWRRWWFKTPSRSLWRHCNVQLSFLVLTNFPAIWPPMTMIIGLCGYRLRPYNLNSHREHYWHRNSMALDQKESYSWTTWANYRKSVIGILQKIDPQTEGKVCMDDQLYGYWFLSDKATSHQ